VANAVKLFFHVGSRGWLGRHFGEHFSDSKKHFNKHRLLFPNQAEAKKAVRKKLYAQNSKDLDLGWEFGVGDNDTLVLSNQHSLGSPNEIFCEGELYKDAEAHIDRLSRAFSQFKITFIVEVAPIDMIAGRVESGSAIKALTSMPQELLENLSWFELINSLTRSAPNAHFFVFDGSTNGYRIYDLFEAICPLPQGIIRYRSVLEQAVSDGISGLQQRCSSRAHSAKISNLANQFNDWYLADLERMAGVERVRVF